VQVHASRQQEPPARVDLPTCRSDVADRADPLAGDRDVGAPLAVRGDDEAAADG
jgi:hypothetical protein